MTTKRKNNIIAILISVMMVFAMLPMTGQTVYADDPTPAAINVGKVTMKAKPAATGGTAYQIQYRIKGKAQWKTALAKTKTKTIKKLQKGKRYQIRVRAFKKVNGTNYYGAWSKVTTTKKVK